MQRERISAFSLIELSIVLVIIGLIVGAIFVGKELIEAAGIRATISQITKYNSAVHTFQTKVGYLPGDIPDPTASAFGFQARGASPGEGDGNGVLEGVNGFGDVWGGYVSGENVMFWADLSTANLIDGAFTGASANGNLTLTNSQIPLYVPSAKLGNGNYVYTWSGGWDSDFSNNGTNYFGISALTSVSLGSHPQANPGLSVYQAYALDSKMDDGLPQSGITTALYTSTIGPTGHIFWAGGSFDSAPYTTATASSTSSCFDNGNTNGATQHYSTEVNSGTGINCALSFQFQ